MIIGVLEERLFGIGIGNGILTRKPARVLPWDLKS